MVSITFSTIARVLASGLASASVILALAGCGASAPRPHDRFYALELPSVSANRSGIPASAPAPGTGILRVDPLAARGFLGGRQIVYRNQQQPLVVERYATLLWEEPVPRAFAQLLVSAIRDAGSFRGVTLSGDRAPADYLLGGALERFEHRPTDLPPRVIATLTLSLVSARDHQTLWMRHYRDEEIVAAATPDAMAEAFNRLAIRLATSVAQELPQVPLTPTPLPAGERG